MDNIKRIVTIGLTVLMLMGLMGGNALAQEQKDDSTGFSAKGIIGVPTAITLTVPMGGQVENFIWLASDRVAKNDLAFLLRPIQVTATNAGTVISLQAKAGDAAEGIMAQYGALCYIERQDIWHIQAKITTTSDDVNKQDVRLGQNLRVQHGTGDSLLRGKGMVIALEDKNFVLEIMQGNFEFGDEVKVYLGDSKDNASADYIGSGAVIRSKALPVMGEGIVASVLVKEGAKVERGQPLFLLDTAASRYEDDREIKPELRFRQDGVIAGIFVTPGQFVQQGQAVMTLLPLDGLEATIEVDELDISKVRIGDSVRVSVDAYSNERIGTVRDILPMGQVVLDTTKFLVEVSLDKSDDLMIGMHVTAYWN